MNLLILKKKKCVLLYIFATLHRIVLRLVVPTFKKQKIFQLPTQSFKTDFSTFFKYKNKTLPFFTRPLTSEILS